MPLPPWLDIRPEQFVRAMQAGTVAGQAAARAAQAQWEEEQRLKLEERRIEAARQQNKAQLDALTQYRLSELGLGKERLGEERARTTELGRHNLMEEALGSRRVDESIQRLKEAQTRGEESLDLRRQMLELQQQRAEDAAAKPHYVTDPKGQTWALTPNGPPKMVLPLPKEKDSSPRTSIILDAMRMAATPFAYMGMKSKIPATPTEQAGPSEPKRVRVKGPNGESGTIPEGSTLPDGWTTE